MRHTWIRTLVALCLTAMLVGARAAAADSDEDQRPEPEVLNDGPAMFPDEPIDGADVSDQDPRLATWGPAAGCAGPGCRGCCNCGPMGRIWVRDEFVSWFTRGNSVPALVSAGPGGTLPTTDTIYGDKSYNGGFRPGNWLQAGIWADCGRTYGLVGDYFFVGRRSAPFNTSSDGDPSLGRPFTDANTGIPTEQIVAAPGIAVGSISVSNYNSFAGFGTAFRRNLCCWNNCCQSDCDSGCARPQGCCRVDYIAGFRYYRFNDNLGINEQVTSIDPTSGVPIGTQFAVNDSFNTANNFYGAELGLIVDRYYGRWLLEGSARVGLGTTQQIVGINGNTTVSAAGQPTVFNQGGILALSSNIGHYTHNSLTAIPQLSGRIGYRVTPRLNFLVGYTAIYWGQVARAADQVDTSVNPNLIPPPISGGPNRPAFSLHLSDLFLQGITVGGEYFF